MANKKTLRVAPKSESVRQAKEDKGAHAAAIWAQLGNGPGVILRPGNKKGKGF